MIYFVLLFVIIVLGGIVKPRKSLYARKAYMIITFGLLIALSGFRSPEVGRDVAGHYAQNYELISNMKWGELLPFSIAGGYEIGYCYFNKLIGSLTQGNIQWFLFITSFFIYGVLGLFIYKKSPNVIFSVLLLLFTCQYYMYMNILRQAMAVSIIILGYLIADECKRKITAIIIFSLFILLAMTFHTSAIFCFIMLTFYYLKFDKKMYKICLCFSILFFISFASFYNEALTLLGEGNKYEMYEGGHAEAQGHINIQSVTNALLTVGAFLSLKYVGVRNININKKNRKYIDESDMNFILYASFFAGLFRFMTLQMNILNRFSFYFMPFVLIAYPIAYYDMQGNYKRIKQIIILLFFIYFTITTNRYAEELYGVIPYKICIF